jgi:hypothetical protein
MMGADHVVEKDAPGPRWAMRENVGAPGLRQ